MPNIDAILCEINNEESWTGESKSSSKARWFLNSETEMFPPLTDKQRREYNRREVLIHWIASLMNTNHTQHRKEVTALDADVPLLRPSLIRFNVSELRMFKQKADRVQARRLCALGAV